ncbi:alpha/beta hydrolase [Roseivirga pacifica]|uniref:alpha/beta hydrolase n=1 Tax=Roseivirga pacifica TaxID=1267423 RepID=UPI003BB0D94E
MTVKASIILLSLSLAITLHAQNLPETVSQEDFSIGKTITINSKVLNEHRELNVYLPPSYHLDSTKFYPVIYLLDGSKDEDFIHITGIVQFGSFPWINMMPESIVVGIGNVDRKRDFTYPSNNELDQSEFPTSGGSAKFTSFIANELRPFINSNYRTNKKSTLIGQSLGGLLATEILFKEPNLFSNYIIVSPSLWWDDEKLLSFTPTNYQTEKTIYIAVGKEGEVMERTANELFLKLKKDKKLQTKLFFQFLEDKTHGDALHQAVYNAFELMQGKGK